MAPMEMLKGKSLKKDSPVRVIAPAGPFAKEKFLRGIDQLKSWGLRPAWREDIFEKDGFCAGGDERRAEEFNEAACDESCRAIFCARGGYGSMRILERIDIKAMKKDPKPIIGFSDNTALILYLREKCGLVSIHGPMPAGDQFAGMEPAVEAWFKKCLFHAQAPGDAPLFDVEVLKPGRAVGRVVAGNLTMIIHMLAAGLISNFDDCLLIIEDVNEPAYRIDRMLRSLKLAGILKGLKGLVFGEFLTDAQDDIRRVARDYAHDVDGPVLLGAPVGHGKRNVPIPVGVMAQLDADHAKLNILESAVC